MLQITCSNREGIFEATISVLLLFMTSSMDYFIHYNLYKLESNSSGLQIYITAISYTLKECSNEPISFP